MSTSEPTLEAEMLARIRGRRTLLPTVAGAALLSAGLLGAAPVANGAALSARSEPIQGSHPSGVAPVPAEIRVPPGNRLVAQLTGPGVQVYECTAGTWVFLEPVAQLHDLSQVAIHFRGPSWESTRDGSLVEATTVASSPVVGAIPQLLLHETLTRGDGIFGRVTYVQRLDTVGGVKPSTPCIQGQTRGVPYSAVYRFYVHA
jgi:hypothetical protein